MEYGVHKLIIILVDKILKKLFTVLQKVIASALMYQNQALQLKPKI